MAKIISITIMGEQQKETKDEFEVEPVEDIVESKDDEGNDTTDWEGLAKKNQGISKRNKTKLEKANEKIKKFEEKPEEEQKAEPKEEEKKGFNHGEKAFLIASGIKKDEFNLVLQEMNKTGKSLDDVLEFKYFQDDLKEKREENQTKEAIPEGTKRSSGTASDSVEYWIAKDKLPPADQTELRRKVVNARIKSGEDSKFSDNPVV